MPSASVEPFSMAVGAPLASFVTVVNSVPSLVVTALLSIDVLSSYVVFDSSVTVPVTLSSVFLVSVTLLSAAVSFDSVVSVRTWPEASFTVSVAAKSPVATSSVLLNSVEPSAVFSREH